jgi:hypothetical protein
VHPVIHALKKIGEPRPVEAAVQEPIQGIACDLRRGSLRRGVDKRSLS